MLWSHSFSSFKMTGYAHSTNAYFLRQKMEVCPQNFKPRAESSFFFFQEDLGSEWILIAIAMMMDNTKYSGGKRSKKKLINSSIMLPSFFVYV